MRPFQLRQLFAMPIQAAVNAQMLALNETLNFIENVGTEDGKLKTFTLKAERIVEEESVDKDGTPKLVPKKKPIEISVPLLALMPPPAMKLQEMNVEFGIEVVEPRAEKRTIPGTAIETTSLAPTLAFLSPPGAKNPTTMKVNMRIVNEQPEGMARLGDVLADMLSGSEERGEGPPVKNLDLTQVTERIEPAGIEPAKIEVAHKPENEITRPEDIDVEKIKGIPRISALKLKSAGITKVSELLQLEEDKNKLREVSKKVGTSSRRVLSWVKSAKLLTEGEKKK